MYARTVAYDNYELFSAKEFIYMYIYIARDTQRVSRYLREKERRVEITRRQFLFHLAKFFNFNEILSRRYTRNNCF